MPTIIQPKLIVLRLKIYITCHVSIERTCYTKINRCRIVYLICYNYQSVLLNSVSIRRSSACSSSSNSCCRDKYKIYLTNLLRAKTLQTRSFLYVNKLKEIAIVLRIMLQVRLCNCFQSLLLYFKVRPNNCTKFEYCFHNQPIGPPRRNVVGTYIFE